MRSTFFRKLALVIAGALLFTVSAHAQNFITVTATVTDPNGIPYAGGTMNAILVPGTAGGWTLGGQPYSGRIGPIGLDSTGSFTANFGSNAAILPASSQWQITVNSNPGGIQPPLGTGAQSFTVTMTISGPSPQSISTTLNAAAPKLTNFIAPGGGVVGCITSGGVAYENGTANTLTCGNVLTFISGTLTNSFSASNISTMHMGDPDSSIPNVAPNLPYYPARNEITSAGGSAFENTLTITAYNSTADSALATVAYNDSVNNLITIAASTEAMVNGITTTDAEDGNADQSTANNGTNITGDGINTGYFVSYLAQPTVNWLTPAFANGTAAHVDFEYAVLGNTQVGAVSTTDTSSVTNMEPFSSKPELWAHASVTNLRHFHATNAAQVAGTSLTNQYGFVAEALSGATNNWGFFDALTNKEQFGLLTLATESTSVNCSGVGTAANPSVATCTTAPAGSFSCATAASTGTCRVNTTAVTANSQIFVQEDDSLGTRLGVTCNTNNVLPATAPLLGARVGGTSFTINLGTFSTNPLCFSYFIVN